MSKQTVLSMSIALVGPKKSKYWPLLCIEHTR